MSRIQVKNLPRLKLSNLLRRRKMTLRQLLDEFGITTYDSLIERCNRMGVAPPDENEFLAVAPVPVNNPSEGVFVIEIVATEEQIQQQNIQESLQELDQGIRKDINSVLKVQDNEAVSLETAQKKQKKKKDDLQGKINE